MNQQVGKVISQSVAKSEKISKVDTIIIKLSAGKPILVPDYAKFTFEEASGASKELPVLAKQVYSDTVPYGDSISYALGENTFMIDKCDYNDNMHNYLEIHKERTQIG